MNYISIFFQDNSDGFRLPLTLCRGLGKVKLGSDLAPPNSPPPRTHPRRPLLHPHPAGSTRVHVVPIRICSHSPDRLRGYVSDLPALSLGQVGVITHLISQAQKAACKWAKYLDHRVTSEIISVVLKADAEATWLLFLAVCCQHS